MYLSPSKIGFDQSTTKKIKKFQKKGEGKDKEKAFFKKSILKNVINHIMSAAYY